MRKVDRSVRLTDTPRHLPLPITNEDQLAWTVPFCIMSEIIRAHKFIILILITTIIVIYSYQYIINVTLTTSSLMSSNLSEYYNTSLAPCPAVPGGLHGKLTVEEMVVRLPRLERRNPTVLRGGEWRPETCQSQHNVAIIIPFRNRMAQLLVFLNHMHSFLQRQELHYRLYVITQVLHTDPRHQQTECCRRTVTSSTEGSSSMLALWRP